MEFSSVYQVAVTCVLGGAAVGCVEANARNAERGSPYGHSWVCAGYAALCGVTIGLVW